MNADTETNVEVARARAEKLGRLGLSVCYDIRFPALYEALAQQTGYVAGRDSDNDLVSIRKGGNDEKGIEGAARSQHGFRIDAERPHGKGAGRFGA